MLSRFFNKVRIWFYHLKGTAIAAPALVKTEPERPSVSQPGQKLLWYPLAQTGGTPMEVQGKYRNGYPEGAIVHFTAGHCDTEQHAKNTVEGGVNNGYAFFVIGPTGVVYQRFPLSHWGYHAGTSSWPNLGSGVSKYLVGIEVCCAGKVDSNGKSWFGKVYPKERLRTVGVRDQGSERGTYVKYTPEQEEALIDLLTWLKSNNPKVFNIDYILGHHSVSPRRKNDPGGSLSLTIPELQNVVLNKYLDAVGVEG